MRLERVSPAEAMFGVRGIAVLAIMLHHYMPPDFFPFHLSKTFNSLIIAAGGYFFASAMLREEQRLQSDSPGQRMRAAGRLIRGHAIRIWPLLAVMVALYLLLGWIDGSRLTTQIYQTWWLYLAFLGNVPKYLYEDQAFPAHFWTIAALDQLLFLMALLAGFAGLARLRRWLPLLVGIGLAARLVMILLFMPERPALALDGPWAILDVVALGVLARFLVEQPERRGQVRRTFLSGALIAAFVWIALPNLNATFYLLMPLAITLASVAAIITVTDPLRANSFAGTVLASPRLVFIGRIGLCLFFVHPWVNSAIVLIWPRLTGTLIPWWLLTLLGPPLAIGCAWLMHLWIERPLLERRRRGKPAAPVRHVEAAGQGASISP